MTGNIKPKVRIEEIVTQVVLDELLVFDKQRQCLHALNPTAAWVWQQLDGETDTQTLAMRLGQRFPELAQQPEQVLWASLKRLEEKQLLAEPVSAQMPPQLETRRAMLKHMGLALALLPVVTTLAAPPPAQAQTCPTCFTSLAQVEACGYAPDTEGTCCAPSTDCTGDCRSPRTAQFCFTSAPQPASWFPP